MALERKKTLNVFKDAEHAFGSYDDYPVGPKGTDPMPHLSRNRIPQPFFLVCEEDQVLIQMSGEGAILFREMAPSEMRLVPGDAVYIPAGVPSRLVPDGENIQIRLKAEPAGREAVAWYCAGCGALVHARELEAAPAPTPGSMPTPSIVQELYWNAVQAWNGDETLRTCQGCKAVHAPADLGDISWPEVAAALRADD